jgi:hypothetical protein
MGLWQRLRRAQAGREADPVPMRSSARGYAARFGLKALRRQRSFAAHVPIVGIDPRHVMRRFLLARCMIGAGAFFALLTSAGAVSQAINYLIFRGDQEIGHYRFEVDENAGRRDVAVDMLIKVKVFFVPVYQAAQQRRETWSEGRLERCSARAVYNGKTFNQELTRSGGRCLWTVNGVTQELAEPVVTFVPWKFAVTGTVTVLTEKGRADSSRVEFLGKETLVVKGQPMESEKYRVVGRNNRELWYDSDGLLIRARYEIRGSMIHIERDSVS